MRQSSSPDLAVRPGLGPPWSLALILVSVAGCSVVSIHHACTYTGGWDPFPYMGVGGGGVGGVGLYCWHLMMVDIAKCHSKMALLCWCMPDLYFCQALLHKKWCSISILTFLTSLDLDFFFCFNWSVFKVHHLFSFRKFALL